jgi:GGDEF domain-containing protein
MQMRRVGEFASRSRIHPMKFWVRMADNQSEPRKMISLLNSISELEKSQQNRDLALECYLSAIRNMAQYAVELGPETTALHRKYLEDVAQQVSIGTADALNKSRAMVRGLLRDYCDQSTHYLGSQRQELSDAAAALERTLEALSQTDDDHGVQLRGAIARLRAISGDAKSVRETVFSVASSMEASLEQMRKQHDLTAAQSVIEIRMLHKRIDTLENAASIDKLTQLFSREEMEARIRSLDAATMSILLLKAGGLGAAEAQFGADVSEQLAGAFAKRLRHIMPPTAVIGRWSEEVFMAMLQADKPEASALAKRISESLAGTYACQKAGKTVRPAVHLRLGVVDPRADGAERVLQWAIEFPKAG